MQNANFKENSSDIEKRDEIREANTNKKMIPKIYDLDKDMGIHRVAKKSDRQ